MDNQRKRELIGEDLISLNHLRTLSMFTGEGNGNPLQHSCLENPHGQRSLVGYSPWGRKESDTTEQLSTAQHKLCPPNRKRLTDVENRPVLSQGEGEWERDDLGV